ncbi:MAG: CtsR family transcriptional regulator [Ruminococcaceae bacterium]|nr:CtsR family transcriptional regulator [Oscillospiraceae bacterium]
MKISELIAREILSMLEEQDGTAEIKRNDFAAKLGCVPSQINYVLSSRFTTEQGYVIESRRGGGGYVKITRICNDKKSQIMHIIDSLGSQIDYYSARSILINLCYQELIEQKAASIVLAAISDNALKDAPLQVKDKVRAEIFKNALLMAV